ncbi:hypothetical protein D3C83_222130 [compost metagenome]
MRFIRFFSSEMECDPSERITRRRCLAFVICLNSSCAIAGGVMPSHSPTTSSVGARIAVGT